MKAIACSPGKAQAPEMIDAPGPRLDEIPDEVGALVEVIRVGIDETDLDIIAGEFGEAPPKATQLIIGHENLGRVLTAGARSDLTKGDLVVATVRRPGGCLNCASGQPDMCLDGDYTERGIKGAGGYLTEYYAEWSDFLVKVPLAHEPEAVLVEPLSVVEKAISGAFKSQERMVWHPRRALVTGASTIALLSALVLRVTHEMEVHVISSEDGGSVLAKWLESIGAVYHPSLAIKLARAGDLFGPFDMIVEATGNPDVVFNAMSIIGRNGIMVLTGLSGGHKTGTPGSRLNLDLVLGNEIVMGSVSSNRSHFEKAIEHLQILQTAYPGALDRLITRRVALEDFQNAFERQQDDIKVVIEIASAKK